MNVCHTNRKEIARERIVSFELSRTENDDFKPAHALTLSNASNAHTHTHTLYKWSTFYAA